jgi:hypothetical protein
MRTRSIAIILAAAGIAAAVPAAQGATGKHQLKLTIRDSTIVAQGDRPGDRQTTAGLISGPAFGSGIESISDRVTSASASTFSFAGTITIYSSHGTLDGMITIRIKPQAKGGATGAGTLTITGGSGRYKGARGALTFTGAESARSSVFVSHASGAIVY